MPDPEYRLRLTWEERERIITALGVELLHREGLAVEGAAVFQADVEFLRALVNKLVGAEVRE